MPRRGETVQRDKKERSVVSYDSTYKHIQCKYTSCKKVTFFQRNIVVNDRSPLPEFSRWIGSASRTRTRLHGCKRSAVAFADYQHDHSGQWSLFINNQTALDTDRNHCCSLICFMRSRPPLVLPPLTPQKSTSGSAMEKQCRTSCTIPISVSWEHHLKSSKFCV